MFVFKNKSFGCFLIRILIAVRLSISNIVKVLFNQNASEGTCNAVWVFFNYLFKKMNLCN